MSRRPRESFEQRVARRATTMAPGGTIASESPVIRPKSVAAGILMSPPGFIGMDKNASGAPGVDAEFYAALGTIQTGDPVVAVAFGHGSVAAPAGWTTLASGTVNNMGYVVAWVPFAGSLDGFGNYTGPLDITFPVDDTAQLLTFTFTGNGTTPSAAAVEYPAVTSIAAPSAPVGVGAFSVVGIEWDAGWAWSGVTIDGPWWGNYAVSNTYSIVGGDADLGYDPTGSAITAGGSGSPLPDMVAIMLGWT